MRRSIGAILMTTVPDTIIRSECRGDANGTMPNRSTSKRDANVAIISIAQHASPNVTGQIEDLRGERVRRRVARRAFLVVLLPLLEILDLRPDRRGDLGPRRLHLHSSTPSR
jgi:hypothetical protein